MRSALNVCTCMQLHTPDILSERAGPVVSNFHSANTVEIIMHSAGRPVLICIIGAMQCHIHVLILVVAFPGIQPNIVMPMKLLLSCLNAEDQQVNFNGHLD